MSRNGKLRKFDKEAEQQRLRYTKMKLRPKITLSEHFAELTDPRIDRTKEHKLIEIVTIAICAVICGADTWVGIETYGQAKYKWLKQFWELPNGIPSHDTFSRVFARLDGKEFPSCFLNWVKSISQLIPDWVLDLGFREDDCRIRQDNAPENLALLRHIAFNLLSQDKTAKIGIQNKRLQAAWDNDYLAQVLSI
jgi:predicted transposase YbfD/YdcC